MAALDTGALPLRAISTMLCLLSDRHLSVMSPDAVWVGSTGPFAGHGGDINFGGGTIWLTDYRRGTVSRYELDDTIAHCPRPSMP